MTQMNDEHGLKVDFWTQPVATPTICAPSGVATRSRRKATPRSPRIVLHNIGRGAAVCFALTGSSRNRQERT